MKNLFPFYFILLATIAALALAGGCSSSTTVSTNESTVTMTSQFTSTGADRMAFGKGDVPNNVDFDSLVVTKVEIFVKDVKLHSDADNEDSDTHSGTIKTGPFVVVFDSGKSHVISTVTIPPGDYDKIKFEIHKPKSGDPNDDAVLASFPEFTTGGTWTSIFTGFTYKGGVRTAFVARTNKSMNLTVHAEDMSLVDLTKFTLAANSTSTLALEFDPRMEFHIGGILGGLLFDPRDTSHQHDLDDNLALSIRVVKM